jgi:hypothetical protein
MTLRSASGSILTLVLLGILGAGVLATIAYGSYYQIARGTQDTVNRTNAATTLTQAAYTLATEAADTDADGVAEPTAGATPLADGWEIPATSGATKADAWGTSVKYCVWDNGSTYSSAGRLNGDPSGAQGAIQFALISAGPDRQLSTSCAQAKTSAQGDDGVRTKSISEINQGVGGTVYYGDPVATVSNLPLTDAPSGKIRVVRDTRIAYLWNGTSWLPLTPAAPLGATAGLSCSPYPVGTLARDGADDLHICNSGGVWKKVSAN